MVLSGGTFQNRYFSERTEIKLEDCGFNVYTNSLVPCNDGGISLGQLAIAAKRRGESPHPGLPPKGEGALPQGLI